MKELTGLKRPIKEFLKNDVTYFNSFNFASNSFEKCSDICFFILDSDPFPTYSFLVLQWKSINTVTNGKQRVRVKFHNLRG